MLHGKNGIGFWDNGKDKVVDSLDRVAAVFHLPLSLIKKL
jgi:hypothetical protein